MLRRKAQSINGAPNRLGHKTAAGSEVNWCKGSEMVIISLLESTLFADPFGGSRHNHPAAAYCLPRAVMKVNNCVRRCVCRCINSLSVVCGFWDLMRV